MTKELFLYVLFPLVMFFSGLFAGKYVTENNLAYKYQNIAPTTIIKVGYDTYQCELQENGDD